MTTRVLLIGSGGREAAIAESVAKSPSSMLYVISDRVNPSILNLCRDRGNYKVGEKGVTSRPQLVAEYAVEKGIDIAVVGPEDPLVSGVSDALRNKRIPCVGPVKKCAMIEGDKSFCRYLLKKYHIPYYPENSSFTNPAEAFRYIDEMTRKGIPIVIKPGGLTGGKGVKVMGEHLKDAEEAKEYAESVIRERPGGIESVVVEERILYPLEATIQTFTDGRSVILTPCVQDYKRAYEGDEGPNTGGMGSYSLSGHLMPFISRKDYEDTAEMVRKINNALLKETGERYQGFLYAQMMKGISPVKNRLTTVLTEVNVRLGDSEAMNVLPILDHDDPVEIYWSIADGTLTAKKVRFDRNATVCKYLVPEGYPETPKDSQKVELDEVKIKSIGARYYWASVNMVDGDILTTKSRAVAVLGISEKLEEAEEMAEKACTCFKGQLRHRSDVGKKVTERIQNTQTRWKTFPKKGIEEE